MTISFADKCKIGFGLLIFLFLSACSEKKKERIPAGILPMKVMEDFLFDLHKAEAELLTSGIRQDTAVVLFKRMEHNLYKKYKLDTGIVKKSIRYYSTHIDLMDSIYHNMGLKLQEPDTIK